MKTIETLIPDIQGLLLGKEIPGPRTFDNVRDFSERLASIVEDRLYSEQKEPYLRLSNLGTPCERQLWYKIKHPEWAEPLSAEVKLKFLYGDILEQTLLFLAKEAGHDVKGEQDEVDLHGVKGRRDAVIDGVLVDVKSASSRSFDKFDRGLEARDDGFGYLVQLDSYLEASKDDPLVVSKDSAAFLVIDKTLGKLCLDEHKRTGRDYTKIVEEKIRILSDDQPPSRAFRAVPDGASGNLKLDTECSYCAFKQKCWPGLRTFIYSTGPRYLTKVQRTPDVREI